MVTMCWLWLFVFNQLCLDLLVEVSQLVAADGLRLLEMLDVSDVSLRNIISVAVLVHQPPDIF
jgi:hypothetical protein